MINNNNVQSCKTEVVCLHSGFTFKYIFLRRLTYKIVIFLLKLAFVSLVTCKPNINSFRSPTTPEQNICLSS